MPYHDYNVTLVPTQWHWQVSCPLDIYGLGGSPATDITPRGRTG